MYKGPFNYRTIPRSSALRRCMEEGSEELSRDSQAIQQGDYTCRQAGQRASQTTESVEVRINIVGKFDNHVNRPATMNEWTGSR